jgi:signal transduction histidine kinase/ligand-binding sensor domain-containing protein
MSKSIKKNKVLKTNYNFWVWIFSLFNFLAEPVEAQQQKHLRFERFTIEQGLSSDRIRDITQDKLGYIWVATESGVSRYDGYDFRVYRNIPGVLTTISDNFINVVYADKYGKVWVGTNSGLNLYNAVGDSFERIYHEPGNDSSLPGNVIHEIFESKSGDLWLGTNNGLTLYDRDSHSFVSQWSKNGERIDLLEVEVVSITEDADGTLWIGSGNSGLITYKPGEQNIRFFDQEPIPGVSFPSSNISKVMADSFGNIWIGFLTNDIQEITIGNATVAVIDGLGRLNTETNHFKLFRYDPVNQPGLWNLMSDIHQTRDGTIWVSTFLNNSLCGLHRFDRQTELFTKHSFDPHNPSSLSWSYSTAVYEDRFNNLWVGTSRGLNKADLSKWQMGKFRVRPDALELILDNFYGIEEIKDGVFWLGLDGPGFIEWNRNTGEVTLISPDNPFSKGSESDISEGSAHIIKKDHSGEIWIGHSGDGVARANLKTKRSVRYVSGVDNSAALSGNFVTGILVDHMNTVWITTTNGLNRYNRADDTFTTWTKHNSEIGSNYLNTIFEDSRGIIWLGTRDHNYDPKPTRSEGLIRFDPTGETFTTYRHDPKNITSLSNDAVNSIGEDEHGNLWIATNNGLNRFNVNDETFEHYHVKDGLPDPIVIGLLFDNEGTIWLSTLKGLSRFNPETKVFRNYDKSDGVQANRFNDYSYYKTKEGELIFGGVAGANYFNPSEIFENSKEPVVHLTNFLVNNSPFALNEPLQEIGETELGWNENSLGFEFTAINFRSPELTVYEYKLEGYDDGWISAGTRRFVNYTNLPPGNYTFHVRAVNAEGVASTVNATMAIRIRPPFWKTWWAYGFYLILFAVGIVSIDRYQRKRLIHKEREEAREKELAQAREIEKAYKELKATQKQLIQSEKMASLGELTAGIAHEIQNPLNFVNNFSEISSELVEEMKEELAVGNAQLANEIASDISQNLQKINHHGKRAADIVKGMLQHSRTSSGQKEPTDINALADEYLRLAYHGLRAKDKSFNADFKTEFDESLPKINVIPQDIGRVLLNLINNAFYAVDKKAKEENPLTPKAEMKNDQYIYQPTVTISTTSSKSPSGDSRLNDAVGQVGVKISVKDNGPGIPDSIKDKIFQPFFTTKPTGQGTGLGLSLAYDIVKAHGGELRVETKEGQGTEFTIILSI